MSLSLKHRLLHESFTSFHDLLLCLPISRVPPSPLSPDIAPPAQGCFPGASSRKFPPIQQRSLPSCKAGSPEVGQRGRAQGGPGSGSSSLLSSVAVCSWRPHWCRQDACLQQLGRRAVCCCPARSPLLHPQGERMFLQSTGPT